MQKHILTGKNAREKILTGVTKVSDAVVSTLGPKGRNCIISRCFPSPEGMQYYMPFCTKDGVTVARNITLTDQLENTGANLIKQAAEKTMFDAGDGTTTTCLLMKSILEKGMQLIDAGANPQELKKGIDEAVVYVIEELKKAAIPIDGNIEKIRQIATVSANNDSVIGSLIADAFKKMGSDGIINIENAKGGKTEIKVLDGISIGKGYESPYFITNPSNQECELANPYILLYGKKITLLAQIEGLLQKVFALQKAPNGQFVSNGNSLLIVCEGIDGEALAALSMNAGVIKVCAISIPETSDKTEFMEDLATVTGATYIVDEKGTSLKGVGLNHLGRAEKSISSKSETILVIAENENSQLTELVGSLKNNLTAAEGKDKIAIENRIAKLTGGIATLYVGGATEVEIGEKKDRVDDAIRATKAAIAEGYVPGGGTAFLRIKSGNPIIDETMFEPLSQICKNAGVEFEKIKNDVLLYENNKGYSSKEGGMGFGGHIGYNAKKDKIEDLVSTGIIDPVKVLRCSLENAASAATMILTSETLICDSL